MTRRIIEIKPTRGLTGIPAGELWSYRYLFGILMWRDLLLQRGEKSLDAAWTARQLATRGTPRAADDQRKIEPSLGPGEACLGGPELSGK